VRTGAEVKVGIITLVALALLAAFSLYIWEYRAGATYTVSVTFENARGLQRGDPVRLAGFQIGEVRSVGITPALEAEVTLAIDQAYLLYEAYKFQIATSGIIQERFVEVIPQPVPPDSVALKPGQRVQGVASPNLSDLLAGGNRVLANLDRTSELLNIVLADQAILASVKDALHKFSQAAGAAAQLAASTSALAEVAGPEVAAVLQNVKLASADMQAATDHVLQRLRGGTALDDVEQTLSHVRETTADAERIASALAEIAADPRIRQQLPDTVGIIYDAAQSVKRSADNLEAFSDELRRAAPSIPKVAQKAEDLVGVATTISERLKPPEINAAFDVVHSAKAERTYSSGRLDFVTSPGRFLRLGIDDIGEESDVNIQISERQKLGDVRYGLVRSRLGFGLDLDLPRGGLLSIDLFDPNNVRADVLADVPFALGRSDWGLLAGMRDIGEDNLLVAGIRLKR
jgi:phospholipid/cholesterol/gamma-HCH transport system substrate-binding protein